VAERAAAQQADETDGRLRRPQLIGMALGRLRALLPAKCYVQFAAGSFSIGVERSFVGISRTAWGCALLHGGTPPHVDRVPELA
jgi:hypothetical protein